MAICEFGLPCPLGIAFTGCGGVPLHKDIKTFWVLLEFNERDRYPNSNRLYLPGLQPKKQVVYQSCYACLPGCKLQAKKSRYQWKILHIEGKNKTIKSVFTGTVDCELIGGL